MGLLILKLTLLFVSALALLTALRRASAGVRHQVAVAALAASLAILALAPLLPAWEVLPAPATPVVSTSSPAPAADVSPPAPPAPVTGAAERFASEDVTPAAPAAWPGTGSDWALVLAALWAAGAGACLLWLGVRVAALHRSVRRAPPIDEPGWPELAGRLARQLGIRRPVSLRSRAPGAMPMVWGLRRPVILLPREAAGWPRERLRAVLAHELGHVARGDLAAALLAHVACAVHWFHPLTWLLGRRLASEREHACDNLVLGQGFEARAYARHLLDVAAACGRADLLAPVMAEPTQLEERIMAILDRTRNRAAASPLLKTVVAGAALLAVWPLASLGWGRPAAAEGLARPLAELGAGEAVARYQSSDVLQFQTELQRVEFVDRDLEALVAGLRAPRPVTRAACAWALGKSGDPRAVAPVIEVLDDEAALVREWGARALGELGDRRAVPPLAERLRDGEPAVREWAARSLAELGDGSAGEPLIAALDDADPEARQWMVRALGDLGTRDAVEPLIARIGDPDAEVRQWIVRALGDLGDERAIPALLELESDPDAEVREWVARALGDLGAEREAVDWDPDRWGPKRPEPLLPGLDKGPPAPGDEEAIASLLRSLASDDAGVREWSARSLGDVGDARAVELLVARIDDASPAVREYAIRSLGLLRDPRAVTPLLETLGDESAVIREWSVRSLGLLEDRSAFDPLLATLADDSAEVREWSARVLGAWGDPRAIDALERLYEDEDADVRRWARRAVDHLRSGSG